MSRLQLAAIGAQNAYVPVNESIEFTSIPITMNQHNYIERDSDKIKFKYISFKTNNDFTEEQFKDFTKDFTIKISIGGTNIISLNMNFLHELNPILKVDDNFCVTLPMDYLINEIYLVSLQQYHDISFVLSGTNNTFTIELLAEKIYLVDEANRHLRENAQEKLIQQISKIGNFEGNDNDARIILEGGHPTKGFFIKGDIDEIMQMELKLNGNRRFLYTKIMIAVNTHKISNNMFYLSFNGINNYNTLTAESFSGSLNMSRIDTAIMNITFRNNNITARKIEVYAISMNLLRYMNGMPGIAYTIEYDTTLLQNNVQTETHTPSFNVLRMMAGMRGINYADENNTTTTNSITFTTEIRPIEPDKTICSITHEEIGEFYCKCSECNNNFDFDALSQWLNSSRHKTCPLCRTNWSNFIKYSN